MKKSVLYIFICIVFCIAFAGANTPVHVPDVETRITAAGGQIPVEALGTDPDLAPPELPAPAVPVATGLPVPPLGPLPRETAPAAAAQEPEGITGFVWAGGGYPWHFFTRAALHQGAGLKRPGYSIEALWDSADGYAGEKSREGWHDRTVIAGGRVFSGEPESSWTAPGWSAGARVKDSEYGFQERGAVQAIQRQTVVFDADLYKTNRSTGPLASLDIHAGIRGEGFNALALGRDTPADGWPAFRGYALGTDLETRLELSSVSAVTGIRYQFEGTESFGSLHAADLFLRLGFRLPKDIVFETEVSGAVDSDQGFLVPFTVSAVFPDLGIASVHIAGGLDRRVTSPRTLAEANPFVSDSGRAFVSADWYARAVVELPAHSAGLEWKPGLTRPGLARSGLTAGGVVEYRQSTEDRGMPVLSGYLEDDLRRIVIRDEQTRLDSRVYAGWQHAWIGTQTYLESRWLDDPEEKGTQRLGASLFVFDQSASRWRSEVDFGFRLDTLELPDLSVSGSLFLTRNFSVNLLLHDLLSMSTARKRPLDDWYSARGGFARFGVRYDIGRL